MTWNLSKKTTNRRSELCKRSLRAVLAATKLFQLIPRCAKSFCRLTCGIHITHKPLKELGHACHTIRQAGFLCRSGGFRLGARIRARAITSAASSQLTRALVICHLAALNQCPALPPYPHEATAGQGHLLALLQVLGKVNTTNARGAATGAAHLNRDFKRLIGSFVTVIAQGNV